jgi:hypothetical protein
MSAEVERALLVLLHRATDEVDLRQFTDGAQLDDLEGVTSTSALALMRAHADLTVPADRVSAVQAVALGAGLNGVAGSSELQSLAGAVIEATGGDGTRGEDLVAAVRRLRASLLEDDLDTRNGLLDEVVLPGFVDAFAPNLTASLSDTFLDTLSISGAAAPVVANLIEATLLYQNLTQHTTECVADFGHDQESGRDRVTCVRLEVCTSLPFDVCRRRIDPAHWPECNPYFDHVTSLSKVGPDDNWYGGIEEEVGPGLNTRYYTTDLDVRFVARGDIAAAAFDLMPPSARHDDGKVSVDRGFLAVVDEGAHRRIQMLKVYRIEDLNVKHSWVCPLWAQQVVMSSWACGDTAPMRRLLKAWSTVMRDVVAIGHAVCTSDGDDDATSRVAPLSTEHYEVPLPSSCGPSFTGTSGQARIAVSHTQKVAPFPVPQVQRMMFGQSYMAGHDTRVAPDPNDDAMIVSLGAGANQGLYLGRLRDASGTCDVPFTLYETGF